MKIRELYPKDGRKPFYGKALVIEKNGRELLRSYDTIVAYRDRKGKFHRTWGGWSATTGRHIYAFTGKHKAEWDKLPSNPNPRFKSFQPASDNSPGQY